MGQRGGLPPRRKAPGHRLQRWDGEGGEELRTRGGPPGGAVSMAFSPDGTRLATGYQFGTLQVWEATTGKEVRNLRVHAGPVFGVAFSPDGRHLATASGEGTAKLW